MGITSPAAVFECNRCSKIEYTETRVYEFTDVPPGWHVVEGPNPTSDERRRSALCSWPCLAQWSSSEGYLASQVEKP